MRLQLLPAFLAATALPSLVSAVFRDEVGEIDYHHELLGLPQRETTFFHRPRSEDKASLLYTLSDLGVLGAVNPTTGAVVWRQFLGENFTDASSGAGQGHLRAGEGASWLCSGFGHRVQGWDASNGRSTFSREFPGLVKDLEIVELTGSGRKDVLVLFEEAGASVVRRLKGLDGRVVWEHRETTRDVPLQVSTSVDKVFVVGLHGSAGAFGLKVSVLDTVTGKRTDEYNIGSKGDIHAETDVSFVGANSATPVVAWTDEAKTKLRVHVLGTKTKQEFPLPADTIDIEVHAPHLIQSEPDFLVHSWTLYENQADVYHIDLKTNAISKAYSLPSAIGHGAFATSSIGANVYFTRITETDMSLTASTSGAALANWPRANQQTGQLAAISAVSEVVKKAADNYAVRAAAVTTTDDWVLIRNGQADWTRPEGLSGAVAAVYAEIPEAEDLARTLEQEADSNPLSAYIHRVNRHINDLQYLPGYLAAIPQRLLSGMLGTEISSPKAINQLSRDSFGLNKLVILATKRGRLYCLDLGSGGKIAWSRTAFPIDAGHVWDVRGMLVDNEKGTVAVQGSRGEYIVFNAGTGKVVNRQMPGGRSEVQSTAIVDSPSGQLLLTISEGGKISDLPVAYAPKQTVVIRTAEGGLEGVTFLPQPDGNEVAAETMWTFTPPADQRIVSVATRPTHDPISSIGRVLGDRRVKYKYLNPNTLVLATADKAGQTLTVHLLDTVSGEILSSSTYSGVDASKGVDCALAENFFLCTFYGQYAVRDAGATPQTLRGYQIVVSDLYESDVPNDRGPLDNAANFSSLHPVDQALSSGQPVLPSVVSQSYILGAPLTSLTVTQTRQGIGSRSLLAYLPETQGLVALPRMVLEPRRPVGRDPTPAEVEEGLMRYSPVIEIDPRHVVSHERSVLGVREIITSPTILESTVLVTAFGVDVFGTRVAPSLAFDYLGRGFNKLSLVATVAALAAGVFALGPVVSYHIFIPSPALYCFQRVP
jgi:ER membrane protein complex subunit 1